MEEEKSLLDLIAEKLRGQDSGKWSRSEEEKTRHLYGLGQAGNYGKKIRRFSRYSTELCEFTIVLEEERISEKMDIRMLKGKEKFVNTKYRVKLLENGSLIKTFERERDRIKSFYETVDFKAMVSKLRSGRSREESFKKLKNILEGL